MSKYTSKQGTLEFTPVFKTNPFLHQFDINIPVREVGETGSDDPSVSNGTTLQESGTRTLIRLSPVHLYVFCFISCMTF